MLKKDLPLTRSWTLSRRSLVLALSASAVTGAPACARTADFAALEAEAGAEIGVAAIDCLTGAMVTHRGETRFAMCSTFKWLLGGLILQRVEAGDEDLNRRISYTEDDLVFHSPVTARHAGAGMTVGDMCAATIRTSDNTAANLLLETLGGPAGFTERVREAGDPLTRLDRLEPMLNENAPGDPRDTTTPAAMAALMKRFLFEDALSAASRDALRSWMEEANTGLDRLRAGFPDGWRSGDKTGTSENRANNDVAFAIPPAGSRRGPVVIASYVNVAEPVTAQANAIHAAIARIAVAALT